MEELLQLLKDANEARRQGASQAQIDAYINQATQGQFTNHSALADNIRKQTIDPSLMARRRQAAQAEAVAQDMVASTGPLEVAASGATLGLSPVLGGLVDMLTGRPNENPIDRFVQGREAAKARLDAFRNQHPIQSAVEELGGGIAGGPLTSPALLRLAQPLEKLFGVTQAAEGVSPSIWNLAKQGAAAAIPAGAIYGAAQAPSLSDVLPEAGKGSAIAAPLGAGVGVGLRLAVPAAEALGTRTRAFFNPQTEAQRQVMSRLARVINPDAAEVALSEAEHLRPGLARVGDVNPIAYGAAARRTPNAVPIEDALRARSAGAGERLAQSAEAAAGFRRGAPNAILASGEAENAFNAYSRSVYKPIEQANAAMNLAEHPQIAKILGDERVAPVVRKVLRTDLAQADPVVPFFGKPWSQLTPAQQQASIASGVTPPQPVRVPFTALQEVENELGRMADRLPAGSNFTEPQIRQAQRALRDAMRQEIPGLQQADAGWASAVELYGPREQAGKSGLLGAFAEGAKARHLPPEQITQQLGKLGEEARSAYRMGLLSSITSDLRGAREGVNPTRLATSQGNQSLEPHLKEAFGSEQALNRFLRENDVEQFFRRSQEGFSGGSQTAQRGDVGRMLFPNSESRRGVFGRLLDQFKTDAVTIPEPQLAEGYTQAFNTQGQEMFTVLDQIRQAQRVAAQEGPRLQSLVRAAAPVAGGPGRKAVGATELAALLALINGGRALTQTISGHQTDRGY